MTIYLLSTVQKSPHSPLIPSVPECATSDNSSTVLPSYYSIYSSTHAGVDILLPKVFSYILAGSLHSPSLQLHISKYIARKSQALISKENKKKHSEDLEKMKALPAQKYANVSILQGKRARKGVISIL